MLLNRFKVSSTFFLIFIALIYALVVGSGLYGYGNDYYAVYNRSNLAWEGWDDQMGYRIATLTIKDFHIGVYVTSFILAFTSGFLIREHLKFKKIFSVKFFLVLYFIAIHTWPIIMSTSNAMRQGLAMSLIFVALIFFVKKKTFYLIIFSILGATMHKSGPLFLAIILISYLLQFLTKNLFLHLFFGIFGFFLSLIFLPKIVSIDGINRIISGDFRLPFLLMSVVFIFMSILNKEILKKNYNLFIFYFSFINPVFFFYGLNWQYERICMMMLFPLMLSYGDFIDKKSCKVYLLITYLLLLFLTFYTGMYKSLK